MGSTPIGSTTLREQAPLVNSDCRKQGLAPLHAEGFKRRQNCERGKPISYQERRLFSDGFDSQVWNSGSSFTFEGVSTTDKKASTARFSPPLILAISSTSWEHQADFFRQLA
ncbi:MAG: hypothetical protein HYV01_10570 [Deltaproteobacteria bacterium]|nr:hypothetical protein [Deltaproteobacteria bacterium]